MAEITTKELVIELSLENRELKSKIAESESLMDKSKNKMNSSISSIKASWLLVAAAITGAISTVKNMISATMEMERNQNKLAAAMRNQGIYSAELLKSYNEQASALQNLTAYGDDEITLLQTQLTQYGLQGDMLKKVTEATLDLASAKGMDLNTAGTIVGKTIASNTNALSRYGATAITAKDETQRAAQAVSEISKLWGGSATANARTFEGQLIILKNRFGDFQESVGRGITVGMKPLIENINKVSSSAEGMKNISVIAKGIASAFVVASAIITQSIRFIIDLFKGLSEPAIAIGKAINKALGGDTAGALEELKNGIKNTKNDFVDMQTSLVDTIRNAKKGIEDIWGDYGIIVDGVNKKITTAEEEKLEKTQEIDRLLKESKQKSEKEKLQYAIDTLNEELNQVGLSAERRKEIETATAEYEKQLNRQRVEDTLNSLSQIQSGFQGIYSQIYANKAIEAENDKTNELNRLQEQYEAGALSTEQYEARKAEIEKKFRLDMAKQEREKAKFDKANAIVKSIIDTAQAVTKSIASSPLTFGLPWSAIVGGLGAAQTALIAAQPLPEIPKFAGGGIVRGLNGAYSGEDGMVAARNGEGFLNQTATAMLGEDAINALNAGRGIANNVTINVQSNNGSEVVSVLNRYFKQFGTSQRGVAI